MRITRREKLFGAALGCALLLLGWHCFALRRAPTQPVITGDPILPDPLDKLTELDAELARAEAVDVCQPARVGAPLVGPALTGAAPPQLPLMVPTGRQPLKLNWLLAGQALHGELSDVVFASAHAAALIDVYSGLSLIDLDNGRITRHNVFRSGVEALAPGGGGYVLARKHELYGIDSAGGLRWGWTPPGADRTEAVNRDLVALADGHVAVLQSCRAPAPEYGLERLLLLDPSTGALSILPLEVTYLHPAADQTGLFERPRAGLVYDGMRRCLWAIGQQRCSCVTANGGHLQLASSFRSPWPAVTAQVRPLPDGGALVRAAQLCARVSPAGQVLSLRSLDLLPDALPWLVLPGSELAWATERTTFDTEPPTFSYQPLISSALPRSLQRPEAVSLLCKRSGPLSLRTIKVEPVLRLETPAGVKTVALPQADPQVEQARLAVMPVEPDGVWVLEFSRNTSPSGTTWLLKIDPVTGAVTSGPHRLPVRAASVVGPDGRIYVYDEAAHRLGKLSG